VPVYPTGTSCSRISYRHFYSSKIHTGMDQQNEIYRENNIFAQNNSYGAGYRKQGAMLMLPPADVSRKHLEWRLCGSAVSNSSKTSGIHMKSFMNIYYIHLFIFFFLAVYHCFALKIHHPSIHPSNGATAQIGPWPPLLRFHNNNVLRCEIVSLTTNPR
jgi:hypothetical protein